MNTRCCSKRPLAGGLLGSLVHAASGGALYRKSSFLIDHLGKRVMPDFVHIAERPHIPRGLGSALVRQRRRGDA